MWYFVAFLIGIFITFLLVCKYNNRKINDQQLPVVWNPNISPTSNTSEPQFKSNFNKTNYLYKPLKYNDDYLVRDLF